MIRIIVILITLAALIFVILLLTKNQKPWNEMTGKEQRKKKIMIASGTSVFLAGLIATFLLGKKK